MAISRENQLNQQPIGKGPVIYWMSRDQRVHDNWALLYAINQAQELHVPVAVFFSLAPGFLGATWRQYDFMIKGLKEVEQTLQQFNIPFFIELGSPLETLPVFVKNNGISLVVTDFSPLRIGREWREKLAQTLPIKMIEVDAHNIVPCWIASPKLEVGARTLRPKIHKLLPLYLTEFSNLSKQSTKWPTEYSQIEWTSVEKSIKVDTTVLPISNIKPGETAAHQAMFDFIENKLDHYDEHRNDPTLAGQSELSPYLHFGHISAQRIALEVERSPLSSVNKERFLEELIVRKELSDNFCYYNPKYDQFEGFPNWAQKTLQQHQHDKREYSYSLEELELGQTHDDLWNAAQLEMVKSGKMHGYLRMYWAKKILEWAPMPQLALHHTIYLNDKYELDGRDPNGYTGAAWSIGGVHDRPWFERPIFGSIRYMNYNGAKRKFNIASYINRINQL